MTLKTCELPDLQKARSNFNVYNGQMKLFYLSIIILLLTNSCSDNGTLMKAKEDSLNRREAELNRRELALRQREELLKEGLRQKDSIAGTDSTALLQQFTGQWSARLTCVEATCTGYAVGDIKNEEWNISFEEGKVLTRARADGQEIRVYSGQINGAVLEMGEDLQKTPSPAAAQMIVRLQQVRTGVLEGRREVFRENNCKIVFDLHLELLKQ
jgi:hypothetical protein